jgi:hypothetical protein
MQELKRVHYHHADGVVLGGRIERPFQRLIPHKASLTLAPNGGNAVKRSREFNYHGIITYRGAHTQVSGTPSHKDGPWTTTVTASIEGLNILDVVTAERVVARISTIHPAEGYHPKISFLGTQFEKLRIGGCDVQVDLNLDMCLQGNGDAFPQEPCLRDRAFLDRVNQQHGVFAEEKQRREGLGQEISDFVHRHADDYADGRHENIGHVLCSLVRGITVDESCGAFRGERLGHVISLPEFGKIYIAELAVAHGEYELHMLRFELGCPVVGDTTIVTGRINGKSYP